MAARKKVAMVAPVPAKPKPSIIMDLVTALKKLRNDRPYMVIEDKPGYWLVQFLGDMKPTKVNK